MTINPSTINAIVSVATLAVLCATALAGVAQLRHMRAGNELEAVLAIEHDFRSREIQAALTFVATELPRRLADPAYRAELSRPGYVDPRAHPEMTLCNWFNRIGTLAAGGFIDEGLLLGSFGRIVDYYWVALGPVIALLRRARGTGQYEAFEYLAYRSQRSARTRNAYPPHAPRLPVVDPWLAADAFTARGSGPAVPAANGAAEEARDSLQT